MSSLFSIGEDELDLDDEVSLFYKSSIYPKKIIMVNHSFSGVT